MLQKRLFFRTALFIGLAAQLVLVFFARLYAQQNLPQQKTQEQPVTKEMISPQAQRYKELETKLLEEAYERAIDPNTYIVGPGDYFSIVIWGDIQKGFQVPVTPEGMLIVPTVGVLKVDGLSLSELKKRVREAALRKYKQKQISTNLMVMRKLRVHVTGQVFNPGTYIATPVDRVSDLIYRAGGLKAFAYTQDIRIRHLDGKETAIDFSSFQEKGDLSQNPFVRGGDVIIVPTIDYSRSVVKVIGQVEKPGYYPLKPGETVFDFLSRHNLLELEQNFSRVLITHKDGKMVMVDLTGNDAHRIVLKNGDVLMLPQAKRSVYVLGAVQKPGSYKYINNLVAKDYVGLAGSTENAGGLKQIKVIHTGTGKSEKGGDVRVYPGDVIQVPIRTSKRLSEYLQIAGQLAYIVFAYYVTRRY